MNNADNLLRQLKYVKLIINYEYLEGSQLIMPKYDSVYDTGTTKNYHYLYELAFCFKID